MRINPPWSLAALGVLVVFTTACSDTTGRDPTAPSSQEGITEPTGLSVVPAPNSWTLKRSMLFPARADMKAATLNGIIYVVGGWVGGDTFLRNVDAYNIATNTWSPRRTLPAPRANVNGVSVIGGKLYVSGGVGPIGDFPSGVSRSLYVYDPKANTWHRRADLPVRGSSGAQGVIGGKLYVLVGSISLGARVFFRYDPETDTWIDRAPPPNQHLGGQGEVINGKFYLIGGEGNDDLFPTTLLHVYSPATNTWTTKAPMSRRRKDFASGVINGKLYVAGGQDDTGATLASTEVYDPATNTWAGAASMPTIQSDMASAVGGDRLFVIGGFGPGGFTRIVQAFHP